MIADSSKLTREEFKKTFEGTDYRLLFSEHGEDALQQIMLFRPNLVVAGVTLRGKSGLELCKEMKSNRDCASIPVLLLKGASDRVSDEDRERVHADGIISTPLRREEILHFLGKTAAEESMDKQRESLSSQLDPLDDDEVIELVDVVEEPESKVRIGDLMGREKEDLLDDITPLETWEKPSTGQAAQVENVLALSLEEETGKKDKTEQIKPKGIHPAKEAPAEEDLFEKVDFEDLLKKVEEIRPSLPEEPTQPLVPPPAPPHPVEADRSTDKFFSLEEFETALHKGGGVTHDEEVAASIAAAPPGTEAPPEIRPLSLSEPGPSSKPAAPLPPKTVQAPVSPGAEQDLQALFQEERLDEIAVDASAAELPREEVLSELSEEEFPEELLEEEVEEGEISLLEKPVQLAAPIPPREEPVVPSVGLEERETARVPFPEKSAQELIAEGIRVMMDDFVEKVVPQIAHSVMSLTMERIEQMVREVVPELAEKAIQEEIRRLQKEEKD